jgi:hypothetical protein
MRSCQNSASPACRAGSMTAPSPVTPWSHKETQGTITHQAKPVRRAGSVPGAIHAHARASRTGRPCGSRSKAGPTPADGPRRRRARPPAWSPVSSPRRAVSPGQPVLRAVAASRTMPILMLRPCEPTGGHACLRPAVAHAAAQRRRADTRRRSGWDQRGNHWRSRARCPAPACSLPRCLTCETRKHAGRDDGCTFLGVKGSRVQIPPSRPELAGQKGFRQSPGLLFDLRGASRGATHQADRYAVLAFSLKILSIVTDPVVRVTGLAKRFHGIRDEPKS